MSKVQVNKDVIDETVFRNNESPFV